MNLEIKIFESLNAQQFIRLKFFKIEYLKIVEIFNYSMETFFLLI